MPNIRIDTINPSREDAREVLTLKRQELMMAGVTDAKKLDEHAGTHFKAISDEEEMMRADPRAYFGAYNDLNRLVGYATVRSLKVSHVKPFLTPMEHVEVEIGSRVDQNNDSSSRWPVLEGRNVTINEIAVDPRSNRTDIFAHLLVAVANGRDESDIFLRHRVDDPAATTSTQLGFETTHRSGIVDGVQSELHVRRSPLWASIVSQ
jgi:hypothetical protein